MNKRPPEPCSVCYREIYPNEDSTMLFEDYNQTILHDSYKCYNFKHYKKQFEKIEDSLQTLRLEVKKIQELLF